MGGVDLDRIEPDPRRTPGSLREGFDNTRQLLDSERMRRRLILAMRDRRGRQRNPAAILCADQCAAVPGGGAGRLAPGVRKLNAELDVGAALTADRSDDALERRFVRIRVKPEAAGRDAACSFDRGGFDEKNAGTAERKMTEMDQMPIGGRAVYG